MDCEARQLKVLKAARSLLAKQGSGFTLVELCKKTRISKSQLRALYPTKAALLAALDGKRAKPAAKVEKLPPAADPPVTAVACEVENPPTSLVEYNVLNDDSEPDDRKIRVLQRAISLLEVRIDEVGADLARQELSHADQALSQAAGPAQASPPVPPILPPILDDAEAASGKAGARPSLIAAYEQQQAIEDAYIASKPVLPGLSRDVMDNARALVQNSADQNIRLEKSQRKSNILTLMSAVTIVAVGLVVGLATMGGDARAKRSPFATASENLASVSGVTIINATGAVVAEQMGPTVQSLLERAEKGDTGAQADLALAYMRGDGVVSNSAAAVGWAGLSASKGEPLGQFLLATLYTSGIKPDPRAGFRWMSAAALNGNVKAMHNVAVALVTGGGVEKNASEAATWFGKAASMGYRDSAFDLAVLYERGEGVAQSTERALYWYDKAAAAGDKESSERAHLLRFGVPKMAENLHN